MIDEIIPVMALTPDNAPKTELPPVMNFPRRMIFVARMVSKKPIGNMKQHIPMASSHVPFMRETNIAIPDPKISPPSE
jgi:hypothetical protein